jgi:hypothetical protein
LLFWNTLTPPLISVLPLKVSLTFFHLQNLRL